MDVVCIGGGPAGLYFSLLLKLARPETRVRLFERNRADDTFGWGVVFSDQTLESLRTADPISYDAISAAFAHWDDIEIHIRGRTIVSGGHGFSGIARKKLLHILQERCRQVGVELEFEHEVGDLAEFGGAGLIVAADGVHSRIRSLYAEHFKPDLEQRKCKYVWLGTTKAFPAFTFIFKETEHGWFQVHAYRFDATMSTFIVECTNETWERSGLGDHDAAGTLRFCETLFGEYLDGEPLLGSRKTAGADWINFIRVTNAAWSHGNIVLLGDAAHTAHFSVGSGTKLAMEDAIALAREVAAGGQRPAALEAYESERRIEVLKIQNAARNSTEWFENVARYARLSPEQFAYSLLTRSQRIGHENLRLRDERYVERLERWLAGKPVPPMFTPLRLRGLQLRNRVVVSPMDMYSAVDGTPNDFHLVHLGSRAIGGAGLVYTEMTCVTPEGRISPGCTGMYKPEHTAAWTRIVRFVHEHSDAKLCLQLGHSGPKGSTKVMWEGMDEPLDAGNWEVVGPSPLAFGPQNQVPRALEYVEMRKITEAFCAAALGGDEAGFDMLELHCAHGYLLSSFITPLMNERTDAYGGSLENRLRYPLEVFDAVRSVWPAQKPLAVRISATDWHADGITGDDAVQIAAAFRKHGADLIDVSTGQTSRAAKPVFGRMFQTPFSDRIRNEVGIATMAVGNIFEPDHVNSIIAAGRADLCALGRPHLSDPYWTLHAAAQLGYTEQPWPNQYLAGKSQLERNLARASQTV